jgi:hypothetical protein
MPMPPLLVARMAMVQLFAEVALAVAKAAAVRLGSGRSMLVFVGTSRLPLLWRCADDLISWYSARLSFVMLSW